MRNVVRLGLVAVAGVALTVAAAVATQQITYSGDPKAKLRMTLLLRDFHPHPMLHVPAHEVPRAKYAVWDVHNHVDDAAGIGGRIPVDEVVRRMDADKRSESGDPHGRLGRGASERSR